MGLFFPPVFSTGNSPEKLAGRVQRDVLRYAQDLLGTIKGNFAPLPQWVIILSKLNASASVLPLLSHILPCRPWRGQIRSLGGNKCISLHLLLLTPQRKKAGQAADTTRTTLLHVEQHQAQHHGPTCHSSAIISNASTACAETSKHRKLLPMPPHLMCGKAPVPQPGGRERTAACHPPQGLRPSIDRAVRRGTRAPEPTQHPGKWAVALAMQHHQQQRGSRTLPQARWRALM